MGGIMLKRRLSSMLLLFMVLFSVPYARAEMRSGGEIGIYGGSVTARSGINNDHDGYIGTATSITNGAIFGIRLGGNFNRYFGIEAALSDAGTKYTAPLAEHTSIGLLDFNALLQFPIGPAVPFVTAGAGWALFINYTIVATNYGAGMKIFLSKHVFMRLDYKKYIVDGNHEIRTNEYYRDQIRLKAIGGGVSILWWN